MIKRYANGMSANTLTKADAELILANVDVENWMAEMMFNYFGAYCSSSNALDYLVNDSEKAIENIKSGNIEAAQENINSFVHHMVTFNLEIANYGDRSMFDFDAYMVKKAEEEAKKNMATAKQISYLEYLLKKANRTADLTNMTKAEASALISELKA